jgi:LDH2 family malate/lactate/ureidoglycolate dehydrogenase
MTEPTVLVDADQEREVIAAVLQRHGASREPAVVQASWLVEADLRGQSSHGIARLPMLVARIQAGLLVPDSVATMNWRRDSVLSVDGARGFGPVVAQRALEIGATRAQTTGIALIAISNSNHLGILAPYVENVAAKGLICIALTTSEALVHPWGGRDAMVGTNPLAIAVPADPSPFVLDMATGQISMGKIIHYSQIGRPLEPGWAVDGEGEPTTDPQAALGGSISPFGGPKGFALGLAFEVLVGSLTGSALGRDVHGTLDAEEVCNKGDVFVCIDQTVVTGVPRSDEVSKYLNDVRSTPPAGDSAGVRIPGERAASERARRAASGVEVALASWEAAVDLAGGVDASGVNLDTLGSFVVRDQSPGSREMS